MRGFASIGLIRPKHSTNVGSVIRAAFCFNASMVAVQGDRTPIASRTDTHKGFRHLPVLRGDNLMDLCPYSAMPVAVDLVDGAKSLISFQHPNAAFYIFGPEDGTIPCSILEQCPIRIAIPTRHCINLAACVNVVLYDRMAKLGVDDD